MNNLNTVTFIPLLQWNRYHTWPKVSQFNDLIKNCDSNGFSGVVQRVDKRLCINEQKYFQWAYTQRMNGADLDFEMMYHKKHRREPLLATVVEVSGKII